MLPFRHRAPAARASACPAFRVHALAAGLMLALAAPVQADDLSATDLDAVTVEGQRLPDYAAGSTRGATRLDLTPRETPQSVSVATRAQMDDFGLDSANDVLGLVTGVNVEQVETDRTYYTARGFDIVNFQRDGLGLPFPYGIQDGDVDTAMYERVEVLRGANGLMSATGNPSATVNFVRKRPTAGLQGSARIGVGSRDYRRVDLDVSGPLDAGGSVRGRAVAAWQENGSHLDRYEMEKQVYYGVVEADLGEATTLSAGASLQKNRPNSPLWGALPLYYADGTPTDYDESTSTAVDWAYWDTDEARGFADLTHRFANGWKAVGSLNRERIEGDSELFYVFGNPDRDTGEGLFVYPSAYRNRFTAKFADVYASGPLRLFGRAHDAVIGANRGTGDNHERSTFSDQTGLPLPAPLESWDGRYPRPTFGLYPLGADFDYERTSVYATVRWNLADGVRLVTGASRTQAEVAGASYGEDTVYDESATTPFAGVVWDLDRHWSLYGSYGEIFNPQTEIGSDYRLLGPVAGRNAEVGAKGEWFDGGLNASVALFRARQENLAESAGWDPATGRTLYRGVDAESTGYEIDIAGRLTPRWQIAGGFTHMRIEDPAGAEARTHVPRRLLRLSTTVDVPRLEGLKLGAALRWQSAIHRDAALADGTPVQIRQDAYALLGLMARYEFSEAWNATVRVDNVTGEKYIPSLYWEQGFYGAPRHASLAVAFRF